MFITGGTIFWQHISYLNRDFRTIDITLKLFGFYVNNYYFKQNSICI